MAIRTTGILRYRYPNQSWIEIPADSYSLVTEQRVQPIPTGRTLYGIYAQHIPESWFPNRIDLISSGFSFCPPILELVPYTRDPRGIRSNYVYVNWCLTQLGSYQRGLLSNFTFAIAWIGYAVPETVNRLQTRCNIQVANAGNVLAIEGIWGEGCPEVQFTPPICPPNTIDCGDCCLPCDSLLTKIRALI